MTHNWQPKNNASKHLLLNFFSENSNISSLSPLSENSIQENGIMIIKSKFKSWIGRPSLQIAYQILSWILRYIANQMAFLSKKQVNDKIISSCIIYKPQNNSTFKPYQMAKEKWLVGYTKLEKKVVDYNMFW